MACRWSFGDRDLLEEFIFRCANRTKGAQSTAGGPHRLTNENQKGPFLLVFHGGQGQN
jgi:hypothetical protein